METAKASGAGLGETMPLKIWEGAAHSNSSEETLKSGKEADLRKIGNEAIEGNADLRKIGICPIGEGIRRRPWQDYASQNPFDFKERGCVSNLGGSGAASENESGELFTRVFKVEVSAIVWTIGESGAAF
jgi:hypothetical protein